MTTPSPLATAIAEEQAQWLFNYMNPYAEDKSEWREFYAGKFNSIIQHRLAPLIEKVEKQEKALALAMNALEKECSKFNFPDEDRPILHEALAQIHTLLKP